MDLAKILDGFIYDYGDVLYMAFLFFSLVLIGIILARQKPPPEPPIFTVFILPAPDPSRVDDNLPPRLPYVGKAPRQS